MKQASTQKAIPSPKPIDTSKLTDIEVPYQDDWFFITTGPQGQPLVYLRFQATGWLTRRIGPYACREDALADLDVILSELMEHLDHHVDMGARIVRFPFKSSCAFPVQLEDPYNFTRKVTSPVGPSQKGA